MAGDARQGWALYGACALLFAAGLIACSLAESRPNAAIAGLPVEAGAGNLEGKEVRFGIGNSAEWAVATGATVLASKLVFDGTPGVLAGAAGQRDVYVLDRRVPVAHYEFPTGPPSSAGTGLQIRVWPAPTTPEPPSGRLAVKTEQDGLPVWELLEVGGGQIEQTPDGVTDGLILDIVGGAPEIDLSLLDPGRFLDPEITDTDLLAKSVWQYANYYTPLG